MHMSPTGVSPARQSTPRPPRMSRPLPLSVIMIACDEADRIGRTLEAVRGLSDDMLVIDSGSRDGTPDIAERCGARVIHRPWTGYGPQKRFAEEQAKYDWLLNLDADEVLQPDVLQSITDLFQHGEPPLPLYRLRIVTVYPGDDRPRPLADGVAPVRLYDRRRARFSPSLTDDRVECGRLQQGRLKGVAYHFSFRSFDHISAKLSAYADLQSIEKAGGRSRRLLGVRRLLEFPWQFLKYALLRRHVTGGFKGLRYAAAIARTKQIRIDRFIANKENHPT